MAMDIYLQTEWQEEVDVLVAEDLDEEKRLVVHNDDFNTFDHVINTLIRVCKHDPHQAEQCTYIIHYRGRCAVKNGAYTELKPLREGISEAGIKATIE